jgi:hypothetical protein
MTHLAVYLRDYVLGLALLHPGAAHVMAAAALVVLAAGAATWATDRVRERR